MNTLRLMARIRSIKPEFWTSEQIAECSPNARLLFIGMWNFCDDYGVHPAKVGTLKMQIFPADDFTKAQIAAMVEELKSHNLIIEYTIGNEDYWYVTGWDKHQRPDMKTGLWPRPDGKIGERIRRTFGSHSANDRQKDEQKEKEKEKEKDIKEIIERDAQSAADEIEKEKSEEGKKETTPPIAAPPSPSDVAYQWAVDNLEFLKAAKEQAAFDGKVKDQVLKFCAHYSEHDAFCNQPVRFFKNKFAAWLITARENAAKRTTRKRGERQKTVADQVTREKVLEHIKAAHGAFAKEITEREISALIQYADMSAVRERCAEIVKSKMNDTNFQTTARTGEATALAGLMGKIGQA